MSVIKKIFSMFFAAVLLIMFVGCSGAQDDIYSKAKEDMISSDPPASGEDRFSKPTSVVEYPSGLGVLPETTPLPDDNLSGRINVETYFWRGYSPVIGILAEKFMQLHPNVEIGFDYSLISSQITAMTLSEKEQRKKDYYARLRIELAGGEADYILYNAFDYLNLYQFSENGVLRDMSSYWENDPDIDEEDYYVDVMRAFSPNNKMTVIPVTFSIPCVSFNRLKLDEIGVDLDDYDSVSPDDILNWYAKVRETDPELQLLYTAQGKDKLFETERVDYIDLNNQTANFNSPEFIDFLERTDNVIDEDPDIDQDLDLGRATITLINEQIKFGLTGKEPTNCIGSDYYFGPYSIVTKGRDSFAAVDEIVPTECIFAAQPLEYAAGPVPIVSENGKLSLSSCENFAIPTSCSDPELAWEFIKFCISEQEEIDYKSYLNVYTNYIPVNKANCMKMLEYVPQLIEGGSLSATSGFPVVKEVDAVSMEKKIEEYLSFDLVDAKQYSIDLDDIFKEYYIDGLITSEECARRIQDRVSIWLRE